MKLLLIVAFLIQSPFVFANTESLEKVSLQLAWKYQFEFAGFIAAKEKGFYQQAGFDVDLLELQNDTDMVDDVVTGKTQFAIHSSAIGVEKLKGNPVVLLANYFKRSALVLLTKPDIYVPIDLINKKVMASEGELDTGVLNWMLTKHGVSTENIEIHTHSFNTKAFESGEVDAITAYLSNEPFFLKQEKIPFNILDPSNYGVQGFAVNLFTSYDYAKSNTEKALKFIHASNLGWTYALNHKQEMIDLIYEKYSKNKSKEALSYEAEITEKLMMTQVAKVGSVNEAQFTLGLSDHNLYSEEKLNNFYFFNLFSSRTLFSLEEREYLQNKKQINMCVDPDWMPYEKIEEGKHVGMSADYYQYFESKLGIKINLIPTKSWSESLAKAKSRQCDLLSLLAPTTEREKFLNFTPSYLSTPLVLATSIDKPFVSNISEVLDKKMGVGKGYAYGEILRERYKNINLVDTETLDEGLDKVVKGDYYGYLDTLATIGYRFQNNYTGQLKISGKFVDNFDLAIGVRNDDLMLLNIFSKLVNSIDNSLHQEISNRWVAIKIQPKTDYSLLWKVLLVAFVIMVIGAMRLYVQKKYLSELQLANEKINVQNKLLQHLSMTDTLTSIANRLKLDSNLEQEIQSFNRYQRPFSVVLLDIDFFKHVNDDFGHLMGDKILVAVCQQIQKVLRDVDLIGRWGGEEFLVICQETQEADAVVVAEKIRNCVRNYEFSHKQQITVSCGVVEIEEYWDAQELMNHVDSALYYSKTTGRDRVTSYSSFLKLK